MSDYLALRATAPREMFGEPDEPCEGCGDDGSSGYDGWRWNGDATGREPCPVCNPQGRHIICGQVLPTVQPLVCEGCYDLEGPDNE